MREVIVAKFNPFHGQIAEDTIIRITGKVPDSMAPPTLKTLEQFYESQSEMIAEALFNSLPQGTLDRVWVSLMRRKMSLYAGKTEA